MLNVWLKANYHYTICHWEWVLRPWAWNLSVSWFHKLKRLVSNKFNFRRKICTRKSDIILWSSINLQTTTNFIFGPAFLELFTINLHMSNQHKFCLLDLVAKPLIITDNGLNSLMSKKENNLFFLCYKMQYSQWT